jgi:hypothetical protein
VTALVFPFIATVATALTIIPFTLRELVAVSQVGGIFEVAAVRDDGTNITYTLEPVDVWLGSAAKPLEIALNKYEPAMPFLTVGEKYVLFLRPQNTFEKVIGFRWGALRVDGEQIVDMDGKPVASTNPHFSEGAAADSPVIQKQSLTATRLDLSSLKSRVRRVVARRDQGK